MPPRSKKKSQRDRLKGRTRPSDKYYLLVEDDTDARAAVETAQEALGVARMRLDDRAGEAANEALAALEEARQRLADCYEPVLIRALEPRRFEELVAEHPARKDHDERWNKDTFPRELFLASVVGDMSREEWEQLLDEQCSEGEQNGLFLTAQLVNARMPDGTIPKD